ncbi:ChaN family lipoprotein [Primorskyibacter sp. S87]|uniref:ChaN family lipoprotein n=1 Tax=Primorskyibacter sp. S87 TaxID=3415126 RepID=UPI003C7B8B43
MKHIAILAATFALSAIFAQSASAAEELTPSQLALMQSADVVLLGEVHDNPDHHRNQSELTAMLQPSAMVWEMLTEEGAKRIGRQALSEPEKLAIALKWAELGWPPLSMYLPVFRAAPDAPVFGALVPRAAARAAMETGSAVAFGADAARFGLTIPLPAEEQAARERNQQEAHCNALPEELPHKLVAIQRLRDAVLTRAILTALEDTGGPVVVITGNGHARKDWGVPSFLSRMTPGVRVFSLGQSEDGSIHGDFDAVIDSPAAERPDPCLAFEKKS